MHARGANMWPRHEIVVLLYIIAFIFFQFSSHSIESFGGIYILFCNIDISQEIYTNDEPLLLTFSAHILTPWSGKPTWASTNDHQRAD